MLIIGYENLRGKCQLTEDISIEFPMCFVQQTIHNTKEVYLAGKKALQVIVKLCGKDEQPGEQVV